MGDETKVNFYYIEYYYEKFLKIIIYLIISNRKLHISLFSLQFNKVKKYFLSLCNKFLLLDNLTIKNKLLFEKIYYNVNKKFFNKKGVAAQYKRRKRPLKFFKSVRFKEGGRKKLRRFRKAYISYYKQFLFNNRKKSSNNNSKFKYSNKFKKSKILISLKNLKILIILIKL